jgi:hypothetical protein
MAINTVTLRKGVPGAATCQVVRVRRSGMTVIVEEGTHGGGFGRVQGARVLGLPAVGLIAARVGLL